MTATISTTIYTVICTAIERRKKGKRKKTTVKAVSL